MAKVADLQKFTDVLDAVREEVAENTGWIRLTSATFAIARRLEISVDGWPGTKFHGQVKRALERLVEEGELVKIKKGDDLPNPESGDIGRASTEPYFATPEYVSAAWRNHHVRDRVRKSARVRQDRIVESFQKMGFNVNLLTSFSNRTDRPGVISIDTDHAEQILEILKARTDLG